MKNKIVYKPTSSKEFEFGGDVIIIELKFCKSKRGIKNIKSFQKDIDKMNRIKRLVESGGRSKVLGLLAIFNKTDRKTHLFNQFISSFPVDSSMLVKYYSGMVEF